MSPKLLRSFSSELFESPMLDFLGLGVRLWGSGLLATQFCGTTALRVIRGAFRWLAPLWDGSVAQRVQVPNN